MLIDAGLVAGGVFLLYQFVDMIGAGESVINLLKKSKEEIIIDPAKILLIGIDENYKKITVNMGIDSHMFVCGLSNCGKSRLVEGALQGKDVTILNAFKEDFKTLEANSIQGEEEIEEYLKHALDGRTVDSKTEYLLIDEILVLMKNKNIEKELSKLLATARHFNLFIVAISQSGTKEDFKCKNLFNVRILMKQLEASTFSTVLGCNKPDDYKMLKQREFYIVDNNGLRKGKTYDVNYIK